MLEGWTLRPAQERGHADHGWLNTHHTFSFALYYDPAHMGFGPLRVINDDRVAPGQGFGRHGHRDMEILSYVVDGALEHRDTLGNGSVLRAGDVQLLRAGTGIQHSEFNASKDTPVRFLQIWVKPAETGLTPGYQERRLEGARGFELIAGPNPHGHAFKLEQDVGIFALRSTEAAAERYRLRDDRALWIQVVRGNLEVSNHDTTCMLTEGDGLAITQCIDEEGLRFEGDAEAVVFDVSRAAL